MSKTVAWIIFAIVVIVILALLAVLPARRAGQDVPDDNLGGAIELLTPPPAPVPPPSPTAEALTSEQEQLADLEATEAVELNLEEDVDTDLKGLEGELRGT